MQNEQEILQKLKNSTKIIYKDRNDLHGTLLSLESRKIIKINQLQQTIYELTPEGNSVIINGTPEYNYITQQQLIKDKSTGFNNAMQLKWIKIEDNKIIKLQEIKEDINKNKLLNHKNEQKDEYLLKRKWIKPRKIVIYEIFKDENYGKEEEELIKDITVDILNLNLQNVKLKEYNWNSKGLVARGGAFHPLNVMKNEFKKIFLEMGFTEMNTRRFVESSFWNFDVLFQPQHHPSRDAHDTFFVENSKTLKIPHEILKKVKNMHENGGNGSEGHKYCWDENEAKKNILRTHTTAITARYLYEIANKIKQQTSNCEQFECGKYFSIDRVFRNETVDATHLAEFHQIEGMIIGRKLGIGHLMGMLETFFKKLGISKLKFKPAFNPYTEPSMEIFGYHDKLEKWIEIGNSGIFRPEMLEPLGLTEFTVIAWGLSLERPAMILYGIDNIRQLVGSSVSFESIRNSKMCVITETKNT